MSPRQPVATQAVQQAVDRFFQGRWELYGAFAQSCVGQFMRDVQAFDTALSNQDRAAARRNAHNLKTVLNMLGHEAAMAHALQAEQAAVAGDGDRLHAAWQLLREDLLRLVTQAMLPADLER